jgi:hypothetical protein
MLDTSAVHDFLNSWNTQVCVERGIGDILSSQVAILRDIGGAESTKYDIRNHKRMNIKYKQ